MATVTHPVFKDQKQIVPDDDVQSWVDSGWLHDEDDPLEERTVLTSFENKLLEQEAATLDPAAPPVETSVSFQPNLTNDTIVEEA